MNYHINILGTNNEKNGGIEMIYLAIIVGCIFGAILGMNAPIISYTYSTYLAIAVIAALDSVFGGISSVLKKNFDLKIFLSGFFVNSILSILLAVLGQKLNVDIYLATIFVFISRMFNNLTIIRRYYVEKWSEKIEKLKQINVETEKEKNV
jgi:small basic protein